MGKKSRKAKNKLRREGGGAALSTAAAPPGPGDGVPPPPGAVGVDGEPPSPPPGAACWICLDGDPDAEGKPIVRDCSCRGDDAGFVHVSCLVNFAETKAKELIAKNGKDAPSEPWIKCPTCRQSYQRWLALEMAKLYMSFIESNCQNSPEMLKVWKLDGFKHILITVNVMYYRGSLALREAGKQAANQMLSEIEGIDEVTKERHMGFIEIRQMIAYISLTNFAAEDGTREGYELALRCSEKVRNYFISKGNKKEVMGIEARMKRFKSLRDGDAEPSTTGTELLESARDVYEDYARRKGEDTACAAERVQVGIKFAQQLSSAGYGLECERLLNDLEALSCRVLGPNHPLTKEVKVGVEFSRRRVVRVVTDSGVVEGNVLGFNCDTGTYNVRGEFSNCETYWFGIDMLMMSVGTPVICHGLKNATHLNGKIGDVMCYNANARRYEVRFEHKGQKPASVKAINLRILFDLPDKQ